MVTWPVGLVQDDLLDGFQTSFDCMGSALEENPRRRITYLLDTK